MRVSTQVMAYIYGHGSNHSLIFRAFVVLFQLTWIMWLLQPPLVPADASFRDREDRLEVLVLLLCRKERASQATCFGGILLAVAACCPVSLRGRWTLSPMEIKRFPSPGVIGSSVPVLLATQALSVGRGVSGLPLGQRGFLARLLAGHLLPSTSWMAVQGLPLGKGSLQCSREETCFPWLINVSRAVDPTGQSYWAHLVLWSRLPFNPGEEWVCVNIFPLLGWC